MPDDMPSFPLPAELTIQAVAPLRDELLALPPGALQLDGAAVERVDAAGLQLLTALCQARRDPPPDWQAPSAALREGARILHLAEVLGLPAANAPEEEQ